MLVTSSKLNLYKTIFIGIAIGLLLLFSRHVVYAQQTDPEYPIYIVQSGDTLGGIAQKFGVSVQEIIKLNNIQDPDTISVGTELKIPGLQISGILTTQTVLLGQDLLTFSLIHQIPIEKLIRINRITTPAEFFAGNTFIVSEASEADRQVRISSTLTEQTPLLDKAILNRENPWSLMITNHLKNSWQLIPGDVIISTHNQDDIPASLPSIDLSPLPLVQGKTAILKVATKTPVEISGVLGDQTLHFFSEQANDYVSLVGIEAMANPGLQRLILTATSMDNPGQSFTIDQPVLLIAGEFIQETIEGVDATTIDANTIDQENQTLKQIINITPDRKWNGTFQYPVDEPCIGSRFGNRRSYNDGAFTYFHTGVDFSVCADNLNIYAAAPGVVVFAGQLPIKGNFTVIDHGWGIYTGYAHQAEILVNVGDVVEPGQRIGTIGNTGRSVGPHLHWEVWVNGIPVDPIDWVEKNFP